MLRGGTGGGAGRNRHVRRDPRPGRTGPQAQGSGDEFPASDPQILLRGDRLGLGQPRREMLPDYHRWEKDPGTLLGYGNQFPQAWEVREGGWSGQRGNHNYPQFEVIRLDDMTPVT